VAARVVSTRPPHPPSANQLADLIRRGRLTYQYHGPRELAIRLATFPLRPTPLGPRLGYGSRYGTMEAAARRWYRKHGRPVTAIIPTYGDPRLALQAARSAKRTTRRGMCRVVIVDDATPESHHVARLRAASPDAEVVVLERNSGFAAAANAGIARAPHDQDVVVLNSDVVAKPGWLERLQYLAYREERIGIVGPKLLYPDGRIQSAGSFRNQGAPEWFDHRYRFRDGADPQANIRLPVLGTTGACMYLRREFLDEVGVFDEAYGMAYEDMDLCLRGWEAGWQTVYSPRATLVHLESQTRPIEPGERELASQRLFWSRWKPWFEERDVRGPDGELRVVYVTEDTGSAVATATSSSTSTAFASAGTTRRSGPWASSRTGSSSTPPCAPSRTTRSSPTRSSPCGRSRWRPGGTRATPSGGRRSATASRCSSSRTSRPRTTPTTRRCATTCSPPTARSSAT
jgi:GT2 family glycosyltransferase